VDDTDRFHFPKFFSSGKETPVPIFIRYILKNSSVDLTFVPTYRIDICFSHPLACKHQCDVKRNYNSKKILQRTSLKNSIMADFWTCAYGTKWSYGNDTGFLFFLMSCFIYFSECVL